jgi:hypothetical protein
LNPARLATYYKSERKFTDELGYTDLPKASGKATLNYSTFLGTDKPDSVRLWRIYHNIYAIFQFNDKIGFTTGFDFGTNREARVAAG